ncbi:alpha/beta hydrolase [Pedobacter nanyangensis]|uniref:alpha/beta hydrolase n=1 Tax=Pedobacter nanyangensis TaxID=1562389 RepID=UPI000DE39D52|nr:alpha/beta hydrolase family protein [Pedobacter nanyangensis]
MKKLLGILLMLLAVNVFAANVDTVKTYSASMKKEIKAVVVTPANYANGNRFPVVYLLHGYSGNYGDWIKKVPAIKDLADQYQLIIVCPDGNFSSWYFDSPEQPENKYETYVATELVKWVDEKYKTVADKKSRAITGLSMGGHGALYLAFKHQDVFSVAGSMSGGVDLRPFPNNWDIAKRIGTYAAKPEQWESRSVVNLTHLLTPNSLALFIQCGTEDFFYKVNVQLHEKLAYQNIPHTFMTNPGAHNWQYWADAIKYQLLFISNNLKK